MKNEMTLSFVAIEENEALARMAMTCFITPLDPTIEEISEFKTIVSEAVTNAILHGYENDGKSLVTIHAKIDDQTVSMTVSDEGAGIDDLARAMEPMYTSKPHMERSGAIPERTKNVTKSPIAESRQQRAGPGCAGGDLDGQRRWFHRAPAGR